MILALATLALAGPPLRYAEDRGPTLVNPLFSTTMAEARLDELVFRGLYTDDRKLQPTPALVESAKVADDRLSMTISLRRGVTWHDGVPFTARDVVFTIEALQAEGTASPSAGRARWIRRAVALHDHSLLLEFVQPELAPEEKLHFPLVPAHRFTSTTVARSDEFRATPVGVGPYRIDGFEQDGAVRLSRVAATGPDALVMREVAEKSYQAKLMLYASLEALVRVLPRDLALLEADRTVDLYPYQTSSWWYVGMNQKHSKLADPRVREAIARMVDVDALLAPLGTGDRVTGPFVPSSPFCDHEVRPREYTPDRGAELLAEAGLTFNGREWLDGEGKALSLRIAAPAGLDPAQDVVAALQAQLRGRGVTLVPEFLPPAEWKARIWRDRAFDLILSQWTFDRNEDIYDQFHSTGPRNFTGYASPQVDALLDRARSTIDPQERKDALRQVHALVAADVPMVFLFTLDSYAAVSARVKDVAVHPFAFFTWVEGWKLE